MGFKCGIVGLPNVGKSTLFNALTQTAAAEAANYPFCTIEPNVGDVGVPDPRLDKLRDIAGSAAKIPTRLTFVDIAGLVRGASKGEGLGNQFLGHIREVDAVAYVLRCFEDADVTHVEGRIDPISDAETVETELMIADMESLERRREPLEKKAKRRQGGQGAGRAHRQGPGTGACRQARAPGQAHTRGGAALPAAAAVDRQACRLCVQCRRGLRRRQRLFAHSAGAREGRGRRLRRDLRQDRGRGRIFGAARAHRVPAAAGPHRAGAQRADPRGLSRAGPDHLLHGRPQGGPRLDRDVRRQGAKAAGAIHTDFEKGFIRAETIAYDDFVALGGELAAKQAGKMRLEGKEYVVKDGDVMLFRFAN